MTEKVTTDTIAELQTRFGNSLVSQETKDGMPTIWTTREQVREVLRFLKTEIGQPYRMLFDLTAIDERERVNRQGQPASAFSVVYTLLSFERNSDVRVKVPLLGDSPSLPSIVDIWPAANWYEREVWDMFGIRFDGHPFLRRLLMPATWQGHPLRKDQAARGTDLGVYIMEQAREMEKTGTLQFNPQEWGFKTHNRDTEYMFLNMGPQHPSTHGVFRMVIAIEGENVVGLEPEVTYRAFFFDPQSGAEHALGTVTGHERWQMPINPVMKDWVLVLEKATPPTSMAFRD